MFKWMQRVWDSEWVDVMRGAGIAALIFCLESVGLMIAGLFAVIPAVVVGVWSAALAIVSVYVYMLCRLTDKPVPGWVYGLRNGVFPLPEPPERSALDKEVG